MGRQESQHIFLLKEKHKTYFKFNMELFRAYGLEKMS